ncbi:hypothetical protein M885DRAFT_539748 [Pelagophyceae sp. CCMP2097]|nr:hypothetical protein M885DRAFT_539748 [Pelagophyceae sp. CCMP2097]
MAPLERFATRLAAVVLLWADASRGDREPAGAPAQPSPSRTPAAAPQLGGLADVVAAGGAAAGTGFDLVQFDDRAPTLFHEATRAWCAQSACCAQWSLVRSLKSAPAGLPPIWGRVKAILEAAQAPHARAVVWLDSDAFFNDADWCPVFAAGSSAIFTPDPAPWNKPINIGLFALKLDAVGLGIAEAHWREWAAVAPHWRGFGGATFDYDTHDAELNWPSCRLGGKFASQHALIHGVLPEYAGRYQVLAKNTTTTGADDCAGVVKHLAAHKWKSPSTPALFRRCTAHYFHTYSLLIVSDDAKTTDGKPRDETTAPSRETTSTVHHLSSDEASIGMSRFRMRERTRAARPRPRLWDPRSTLRACTLIDHALNLGKVT